MYDCSSFTCAKASLSLRTREHQKISLHVYLRRFVALTFEFEGILCHLVFGHVDNSMHIEGDLLGIGGPALITEAVVVFSVRLCGEGVIVRGNGLLEVLAVSQGILNLGRPSISIYVLQLDCPSFPV